MSDERLLIKALARTQHTLRGLLRMPVDVPTFRMFTNAFLYSHVWL